MAARTLYPVPWGRRVQGAGGVAATVAGNVALYPAPPQGSAPCLPLILEQGARLPPAPCTLLILEQAEITQLRHRALEVG